MTSENISEKYDTIYCEKHNTLLEVWRFMRSKTYHEN